MSMDPVILVYPRAFYLDQLERGRPAGALLEQSEEQVRVEITRPDLELLRYDATVRAALAGEPNDSKRLVAKATCVRIRWVLAQVKRGRYS